MVRKGKQTDAQQTVPEVQAAVRTSRDSTGGRILPKSTRQAFLSLSLTPSHAQGPSCGPRHWELKMIWFECNPHTCHNMLILQISLSAWPVDLCWLFAAVVIASASQSTHTAESFVLPFVAG